MTNQPTESGYNVWQFNTDGDASQQTLLGTFASASEALAYARRNGGHQVQRGTDGEVINLQSGG